MNHFEPNTYNLDIANFVEEEQSSARGKDLTELTGCKRPSKAGGIAKAFLTLGVSNLRENKIYKQKLKAYNQCMADYKAKIAKQNDAVAQSELKIAQAKEEAEQAKKQAEEAVQNLQTSQAGKSADLKESDKILGMPKMVAYGVGALLLLAVGGFLIYKKMNK